MISKHAIPINLPNVILDKYAREEAAKYKLTCVSQGVFSHLLPLVEALAVKHPEWEFRCVEGRMMPLGKDEGYELRADKFSVWCKREQLGAITVDYSYGREKYMFTLANDRIKEDRKNGEIKTSDLGKAINVAEKYFVEDSLSEVFDKRIARAYESLGRQIVGKNLVINALDATVKQETLQFIRNNRQQLLEFLSTNEGRAELQRHFAAQDDVSVLERIQDKSGKGCSIRVVQRGDKYLVAQRGVFMQLSVDQLSEPTKYKLGILKLVQDGQAVDGVGFRHDHETFILVEDQV